MAKILRGSKDIPKFKPEGAYRAIYDLRGMRFGDVEVLELVSSSPVLWKCKCVCGIEMIRSVSDITRDWHGKSNSCGCRKKDCLSKITTKHNFAHRGQKERLYRIWLGMRGRCNNKNNSNYKWYGGRGITVCREWDSYVNFRTWSLANEYRDILELDRIDNESGYSPDNCRWVTHRQNMNNTRRQYA